MRTGTDTTVQYETLERRTVGGVALELTAPPEGLVLRSDLGILLPASLNAQRLHAWPAPNNIITTPRAIKTPDGDYLVMFLAGRGLFEKNEKTNDMVAYRSSDRGATWQGPTVAWDIPYVCLAAVLFIPRGSDTLYAFGTEYRPDLRTGEENGAIGFRTSNDGGRTWSDVQIIQPVNDPDYRGIAAMPMTETDAGTWLLSTHSEIWRNEDWQHGMGTRQFVLRSSDRGQSWELLPGPAPDGWYVPEFDRMDEGRPLALGGGKVLLMVRTPEGHLWELRSNDDGRTWTPPKPTSLVHPDAPPMLFQLADANTLVAFHHNRHTGGHFNYADRSELWVSLSHDHGLTWSEPRFVLANAAQPFEIYPGLMMEGVSYADLLVDGNTLHLFVDHQFRQVIHIQFTERDFQRLPTQAELAHAT
jgi:hypothetical protein